MITGGTGALGKSVTLDLLRAGATVAVPYREESAWRSLQEAAGEHASRLRGGTADLNISGDVDRFVDSVIEHYGRVDFLVCVAGGFAAGKSFETEDQAVSNMLQLNLMSVVRMLRPLLS